MDRESYRKIKLYLKTKEKLTKCGGKSRHVYEAVATPEYCYRDSILEINFYKSWN